MGSRCMEGKRGDYSDYIAVAVTLRKRKAVGPSEPSKVVLTIGNDQDAIDFVKENMDRVVANVVRVKQMNANRRTDVEESAQLFKQNLEPLFSIISATANEHVLDKLSLSLRKALLLMAMERYSCDSDRICRALGISRSKLERELKRCGLQHQERNAA